MNSTDAAVRGHRLFAPGLDDVVLHPPIQRFLGAGSPATPPCTSARSGHPERGASAQASLDRGYRAARELSLRRAPSACCGGGIEREVDRATAIWTLLEAAAPPPTIDDVACDGAGGRIRPRRTLPRGRSSWTTGRRHAQPQPRRSPAGALPAGELRSRGSSRPRRAAEPPRWPSSSASGPSPLGRGRRRARARRRDGAPPRLEPPPLRAPDRGAGALPWPARPTPPLPPAAGAGADGSRSCTRPTRRSSSASTSSRSSRSCATRRPADVALPARAAGGSGVVPRTLGVRQQSRGFSSHAARCLSRAGPRS